MESFFRTKLTAIRLKIILVLLWIVQSIWVAHYHEPWRDEAQAWLVVTHASSFMDLVYRAAAEASGPLYYLMLWPWAHFDAHSFPVPIFWVSWLGSLACVLVIVFSDIFPRSVTLLTIFGFLLGYEFPVVARLYGWGAFFLLSGIVLDIKKQPRGAIGCFCAGCFVQLSFTFAIAAWCTYRVITGRPLRRYLPVLLASAFSLLLLNLHQGGSHWLAWSHGSLPSLGTTLSMPFVNGFISPKLAGIPIFLLGIYTLSAPARLAFLVGLVPYAILFQFLYRGSASSRHAGALFLLWLILLFQDRATVSPSKRAIVGMFLVASFFFGISTRARELRYLFSDGLPTAETIKAISLKRKRTALVLVDSNERGFVVAASLGIPFWANHRQIGCPFFSDDCIHPQPTATLSPSEAQGSICIRERACFLVSASGSKAFPFDAGNWQLVREGTPTLSDESFDLYYYEFRAAGGVVGASSPAY